MGQSEVLEVLEEAEKPLSAREIAEILDEQFTKISATLRRLLEAHDICAKELNYEEAKKQGYAQRRLRLFFVKE